VSRVQIRREIHQPPLGLWSQQTEWSSESGILRAPPDGPRSPSLRTSTCSCRVRGSGPAASATASALAGPVRLLTVWLEDVSTQLRSACPERDWRARRLARRAGRSERLATTRCAWRAIPRPQAFPRRLRQTKAFQPQSGRVGLWAPIPQCSSPSRPRGIYALGFRRSLACQPMFTGAPSSSGELCCFSREYLDSGSEGRLSKKRVPP